MRPKNEVIKSSQNAEKKTVGKPITKSKQNVWIILFSQLVARFGLGGTVVIVILYTFIKEGSTHQHQEFIDKFILLKFHNDESSYLFFILILLIIVFAGTVINLKRQIKDKEERITDLQKEKNDLQNKLLK